MAAAELDVGPEGLGHVVPVAGGVWRRDRGRVFAKTVYMGERRKKRSIWERGAKG